MLGSTKLIKQLPFNEEFCVQLWKPAFLVYRQY